MPTDDFWKEQLTLISGNFLVWGILLLKMWPFAAGLQTGGNIHYLTVGGPRGEDLFFKSLAGAMAVAVGVTAVASLHILCRGIWLAVTDVQLRRSVDAICLFTFNATIVLVVFLTLGAFFVPLLYLKLVAVSLLMSHLGSSYNAANWLGTIAITALTSVLLIVLIKSVRERLGKYLKSFAPASLLPYVLALIAAVLLGFIVLEGCYTLELKTNAVVYRKERSDVIEIYVTLGGATSSVSDARLKLISSSGSSVENLPLIDVGEGRYVACIFSPKLSQGAYQLSLYYPHSSLGLFYPFFRSSSQKSVGFIVVSNSP